MTFVWGYNVKSLHFIRSTLSQPRSPSMLKLSAGRLGTDWQLIPVTYSTEQCVVPTVYTMNLATHTAHIGLWGWTAALYTHRSQLYPCIDFKLRVLK